MEDRSDSASRPGGDPETSARALAAEAECRFRERLRLFAARRLGSVAEAEDVAQETLRRALEALQAGRVSNLEALPAFLFQTARHICLHRGRSAAREHRALRRFAASDKQLTEDPLAVLIRDERRESTRLAIEKLEPGDQEVLRLTYGNDLEAAEIGRRLGISSGAVRVRRHRAIRRLAEILGVTNSTHREHEE